MRYNEQDVQEILRRAAAIEAAQGDITRENLIKTASELGISAEAVLKAEEAYRTDATDEEEFREFKQHQRQAFRDHFVWYVSVNLVLLGLNWWLSDGRITWAIWPLAGWGIGIFFHAVSAFLQSSQGSSEEFTAWKRERDKERRKKQRELRRERRAGALPAGGVEEEEEEEIRARLS